MEDKDYRSEEQNAAEEGAKQVGAELAKKAGKAIWKVAGKYILLFFGGLIAVSLLLILILFIPSLSIKHASESLTGSDSEQAINRSDFGSPLENVDSYTISSGFGPRNIQSQVPGASTWHKGIDIACPTGTTVLAAASGTVASICTNENATSGLAIYITTADGYELQYMHLSQILVTAGQTVSQGDVIGKSGSSGRSSQGASYGAHLHYGIKAPEGVGTKAPNGNWYLNPADFLHGGIGGENGEGGEDPGSGENPGDGTGEQLTASNKEEYWYNAENVKQKLDLLYTTISDMNNGMTYLTKDNFDMILDKVIAYSKSVRRVDNAYTYYHHLYKKEVTYVREVITPSETEDVTAQGEGDDGVSIEDKVDREYTDADGNLHQIIYTWKTTDKERKDELGHVTNASPEDDPLFKISWEEILTMAAMKSVVQEGREDSWVTDATLQETERPNIDGVERLSEETVKQIINDFQFEISYYFDPTSGDTMPGSAETYAAHTYSYDEMESYAYIKSKEGENVEHGTEVWETPNFDYYEYKKPAIAPAYAVNAYTTIEYDYTELPDGTAILAGRQVIVDGQKFYDHVKDILGEDFKLEWFVQFLSMLPGSRYDAGNGDLATRFNMILTSYKNGEPYSYYDSTFAGVGEVILGSGCSREPKVSTRRDENGDPINTIPEYNIDITVSDIDDAQIQADILAGKYTLEDLVYMAACCQAEAGSVEGQVAVGWLLRNRLAKGNYASIKEVVSAPGQFSSPWRNYLNGSYSKQAQNCAASVLRGEVANPIENAYFFFSASSCWGHKPGVWYRNVGGNMYYVNWGDVTQVVNRAGYVPF